MSDRLEFDEAGAMDYVRKRAVQFLTRAALTVQRRAKELLSVPGTAVSTGRLHAVHKANVQRAIKATKAAAKYNEANREAIEAGTKKALRVTQAGNLTTRKRRRKKG